ncbi:MAG: serpin family protein [Eubacteriales bacterium]|nr:serpin family protein [Eubacteriales bacterium]
MKQISRITALLLGLLLLFSACAAPVKNLTASVKPNSQPESLWNDNAVIKERSIPAVNYATDLFSQAAAKGEQNTVISPVSAYLCLALVLNGAEGETLAQMEQAMGASREEINALCQNLTALLEDTAGNTKTGIANAAWVTKEGFSPNPAYLEAIAKSFHADVYQADLTEQATIDAINSWVLSKTHGLIPSVLQQPYDESTLMVLINSLYFKAKWRIPFDALGTEDEMFALGNGEYERVPFMQMYRTEQQYIHTEQVSGVVLPYDDGNTVFLALKPEQGTAAELAQSLTGERLSEYLAGVDLQLVNLFLPKFTVEYGVSMNALLQDMGMTHLFDPTAADLSGMGSSSAGNIYLNQVFQKVKIIVDEEGTEAAAVTVAEPAAACAPNMDEPIEMRFDSPFVYAVINKQSAVPLFIGVMDNPA